MKIQGMVTDIKHISVGGGAIFRVQSSDRKKTIKVVANYQVSKLPPPVGSYLSIDGNMENGLYGNQLIACALTPIIPSGKSVLGFVKKYPSFVGLIPKRAIAFIEKEGIDLGTLLNEGNPQKLLECGFFEQDILTLISCWKKYCLWCAVNLFFQTHNIPKHLITASINFWGDQTISVLKNNPYVLCPLLPWNEVDRFGRDSFSIGEHATERLIGAVKSLLGRLIRYGQTTFCLLYVKRFLRRVLLLPEIVERALVLSVEKNEIEVISVGRKAYLRLYGISKIERNIVHTMCSAGDEKSSLGSRCPSALSSSSVMVGQRPAPKGVTGNVLQQIANVKRCFLVCSYSDFISYLETVHPSDFSVTHVVPTLNYGSALRSHAPTKIMSFFELLRLEGWPKSTLFNNITFIHSTHSVDTLTLNKLLLAIPKSSAICLVGQIHLSPIWGVGSPFKDFVSVPSQATPPSAPSAAKARVVGSFEAEDVGTNFENEKAVQLLFPHINFHSVENEGNAVSRVLSIYREKSEVCDTVICSATQKTAAALNDILHSEQSELRKYEGYPPLFLSLRGSEKGTVGDKVVFYGCDYSRGLISGARGVIKEIYSPIQFSISENGQYISHLGVVAFDTIGDVEITDEQQDKIALGYAVPLRRLFLSRWQEVIGIVEDTKFVTMDWLLLASSLAEQATTIVSKKSLFKLLLRRQKELKASSAYLQAHQSSIAIIDVSHLNN